MLCKKSEKLHNLFFVLLIARHHFVYAKEMIFAFALEVFNTINDSNIFRLLARNFKTCAQDSLLGAVWHPRMKNMHKGIRI